MLVDDFGDVFHFNVAVKSAFGINDDERTDGAKTVTTCFNDFDVFVKSFLGNLSFKLFNDFPAVV